MTDIEPSDEIAAAELDLEPKWSVQTLSDADWVLQRLSDLRAEEDELASLFKAAVERAQLKRDQLLGKIKRGVGFFEAHLRLYAEANRAELLKGGKRKSRDLIWGRLGWKTKASRLTIVDTDACLAWCQRQPVETGVLRIKEEPALAVIQERFKRTGEVPPGCEVSEESEEFFAATAHERERKIEDTRARKQELSNGSEH